LFCYSYLVDATVMSYRLHLVAACLLGTVYSQYDPTWESLDTRPLPPWYDEAKIGIFIHWGVYSVPAFGGEWFWEHWEGSKMPEYVNFMKENYRPDFTYADFAADFTAEFFDPVHWAKVFEWAGAKYVVLTSKHHEGYTNWPSANSWTWNSMEVGPKRDLVGDLATAIKENATDIHFGLYHSMYEWFHPLYLADKENGFLTNDFVATKTLPELYEIVNAYEPEVVWSDGDWDAPDWYWNSTVFLAWLFNDSPVKDTVVVNDRWGRGIMCHHGSYYTCADNYSPGVLQPFKWENCMTLDKDSWGYRREAVSTDYITIKDLLSEMASTISCGGNILINIGPTHDGRLPPIMEERLLQLGSWLDINGDAIYSSKPWSHQNDTTTSGVWYTSKNDTTYAIVLKWPKGNELLLGSSVPTVETNVTMLGYNGTLQVATQSPGMKVTFPDMSEVTTSMFTAGCGEKDVACRSYRGPVSKAGLDTSAQSSFIAQLDEKTNPSKI
ncbi:Tissue alpha-L-fucosidase, partial [Halocaridina rubra]